MSRSAPAASDHAEHAWAAACDADAEQHPEHDTLPHASSKRLRDATATCAAADPAASQDAADNAAPRPDDAASEVYRAPSQSSANGALAASESDASLATSSPEEEEEEEPLYHFTTLGWSAHDIFAHDALSALAVSRELLAIGMHSGMIYVLNKEGLLQKGFQFHNAAVHQLVWDTTGTFVGSAGMDGIVALASIHTSEQYRFDFKRPMQTLALEPQFGQRSSRAFVCGGMSGALMYREKRWFGHKESVLYGGEGPIWATAWCDRWIAWASDRGVRILDTTTHEPITLIPAPEPGVRMELARCTLTWCSASTLLIAQGQRVTVAQVCTRDEALRTGVLPPASGLTSLVPGLSGAQPAFYVEITDIFQLDCLISGIAQHQGDLVALAYAAHPDDVRALYEPGAPRRQHTPGPPELRLINAQGEEVGADVLDMDAAPWRCNDFHLASILEATHDPTRPTATHTCVLYLASPSQIVVARPRTERDKIEWLLERQAYHEALEALEALGSEGARALGFDTAALGREYLAYLIDTCGDYQGAAARFPALLRADANAWEEMIFLYMERDQLPAVLPQIPVRHPELSEVVYDMVLVHLLHTDETQLLRTLQTWPAHLYSRQAVAVAIHDRPARSPTLVACLAALYLAHHAPGKALTYLLQLRDPSVFALIREHNLFTDVQDKLGLLVELDQDVAGTPRPAQSSVTPLLVDHLHSIPIHRAMLQLAPYPWYAYQYLDALMERDPQLISGYADQLVTLYAQLHYAKLMPFLRTMSNMYSFEKAYQTCAEHDYVPEMVFLLRRTGDVRGALNLMIERLHDVRMAIDFVKQQDDEELWERLLLYSQNRPAFIRGLLEHVGGEIDPVRIIRPIREGLEIPHLKAALVQTLHTIHLQYSLLEGCSTIQSHGVRELMAQYQDALHSARYCDSQTRCIVCAEPLWADTRPAVLFFCWHTAHGSCVAPKDAAAAPPATQPRAPAQESATAAHAREGMAWIGNDLAEPTPLRLVEAPEACTPTAAAHAHARAHRRALFRAQQLRSQPLARTGCPHCAQTRAYRLEA